MKTHFEPQNMHQYVALMCLCQQPMAKLVFEVWIPERIPDEGRTE